MLIKPATDKSEPGGRRRQTRPVRSRRTEEGWGGPAMHTAPRSRPERAGTDTETAAPAPPAAGRCPGPGRSAAAAVRKGGRWEEAEEGGVEEEALLLQTGSWHSGADRGSWRRSASACPSLLGSGVKHTPANTQQTQSHTANWQRSLRSFRWSRHMSRQLHNISEQMH